jgi:hypothetical protein
MPKYVPYIRTVEGYIERVSYAIFNSSDDSLDPYVHEESLVGWPETKVFWAKNTGPSVGLAPLNSSLRSSLPSGQSSRTDNIEHPLKSAA